MSRQKKVQQGVAQGPALQEGQQPGPPPGDVGMDEGVEAEAEQVAEVGAAPAEEFELPLLAEGQQPGGPAAAPPAPGGGGALAVVDKLSGVRDMVLQAKGPPEIGEKLLVFLGNATSLLDSGVGIPDERAQRVVDAILKNGNLLVNSGRRSAAWELAVSRPKLVRSSTLLAATTWLLWCSGMRTAIRTFLEKLRDTPGGCERKKTVLFLGVRLDESKFKLVNVDQIGWKAWKLDQSFSSKDEAAFHKLLALVARDTEPSKLLQTEFTIGLLVWSEDDPDAPDLYTWCPPQPHQSMGRTTATCYFRCVRQSIDMLSLEGLMDLIDFIMIHVLKDGDAAVARCFRAYVLSLPEEFQAKMLATHLGFCIIHNRANIRQDVADINKPLVSKITHLSLAMQSHGGIKTFRKAVLIVLEKCVKIVRDRAAFAEKVRCMRMLDDLLPDGIPGNRIRKWVIFKFSHRD
jgi:hypothetical protein